MKFICTVITSANLTEIMLSVSSEYQDTKQNTGFHDNRKGTEKRKHFTCISNAGMFVQCGVQLLLEIQS